jgi:hypothetical protein
MFAGETGMIAGQPIIVLARITQGGLVLELRPEDLRILVAHDAGLSEIFLRAFVLRSEYLVTCPVSSPGDCLATAKVHTKTSVSHGNAGKSRESATVEQSKLPQPFLVKMTT